MEAEATFSLCSPTRGPAVAADPAQGARQHLAPGPFPPGNGTDRPNACLLCRMCSGFLSGQQCDVWPSLVWLGPGYRSHVVLTCPMLTCPKSPTGDSAVLLDGGEDVGAEACRPHQGHEDVGASTRGPGFSGHSHQPGRDGSVTSSGQDHLSCC